MHHISCATFWPASWSQKSYYNKGPADLHLIYLALQMLDVWLFLWAIDPVTHSITEWKLNLVLLWKVLIAHLYSIAIRREEFENAKVGKVVKEFCGGWATLNNTVLKMVNFYNRELGKNNCREKLRTSRSNDFYEVMDRKIISFWRNCVLRFKICFMENASASNTQ